MEDFKQVDSEIGTNEELKRLTKELRKRGISLCLDVVMNHTADTHEWAIRAKRGEAVSMTMDPDLVASEDLVTTGQQALIRKVRI